MRRIQPPSPPTAPYDPFSWITRRCTRYEGWEKELKHTLQLWYERRATLKQQVRDDERLFKGGVPYGLSGALPTRSLSAHTAHPAPADAPMPCWGPQAPRRTLYTPTGSTWACTMAFCDRSVDARRLTCAGPLSFPRRGPPRLPAFGTSTSGAPLRSSVYGAGSQSSTPCASGTPISTRASCA